jgi:3-hydroxyacyl-[acyl-carrier-protein] dehydratase
MENEKSSRLSLNTETDIIKILEILPHRYPFLMIDRIIKIHKEEGNPVGSWIEGIKNVTFNEPLFQGHFPDYPVFPGVMTLEAMAQLGAILVYHFAPGTREEFNAFLTGIDGVRFRAPITPGDTVKIKMSIIKERKRMLWCCHGEAFVDDQLVCEADIMASLMPKDRR